MESEIWSRVQDKFAHILMVRGQEVHLLKVTGISFTLKRKVQGILESLQQGQGPADLGAKPVAMLDARTISKAEVAPGNGSLTLYGEGEKPTKLSFSTSDSNADAILQTILAKSGREFLTTQEEIGVFEALLPPVITGVVGGLFWAGIFGAASKMDKGEVVEVKGRRQGVQRLLVTIAETLGTGGTIALGVALAVLILGWIVMRIVNRPQRNVWLPEAA